MFWNKEIKRKFGTFYIEEEEDGRIDFYDSKERWMSHIDYDGDTHKSEILRDVENISTLKGLLAYIGLEYYDIIEGFQDAVNYAYENGYLHDSDAPEALYDNEWVNFIGNNVIFVIDC